MLKWDGIQDSHSNPDRVWLTRFKDSDPWTPLRKCDCKLINKSAKKGDKEVLIEFGRATVDLEKKEVRYNFHNTPGRQLCSALWFQKHKKSEKDATLTPIISTNDELLIEEFYLQIINSSPFQEKSNLKQEVILTEDEGYKVYVEQNGNSVSIHKRPISVMANIAEGSTKLRKFNILNALSDKKKTLTNTFNIQQRTGLWQLRSGWRKRRNRAWSSQSPIVHSSWHWRKNVEKRGREGVWRRGIC